MLCFEIYVNGEMLCTAGLAEHGTFSANIVWYNRMRMEGEVADDSYNGEIYVTGFEDHDPWRGEYLKWFAELADWTPGDEILIKVVESDSADLPKQRGFDQTPEQEKIAREFRRQNYERLKREFESD